MNAERRNDISHQGGVKTIIIEKKVCHTVLLEVPEHSLRKTADGRIHLAGKAHGNIVARKHHLIYLTEHFRLILLHPRQLGGSEVAGGVQQVRQALFSTQVMESTLAVRNGTGVAPDDGRTKRLLVLIDTHQAVHLIGNADGRNVIGCSADFCHHLL